MGKRDGGERWDAAVGGGRRRRRRGKLEMRKGGDVKRYVCGGAPSSTTDAGRRENVQPTERVTPE